MIESLTLGWVGLVMRHLGGLLLCKLTVTSCLLAVMSLPTALLAAEPNSVKIFVEQDRLYRVTGTDMTSAGLDLGRLRPDRINLTTQGRVVPIAIEGLTSEGSFAAGSSIIFWGEFPRGQETRADVFTKENVYTLLLDASGPPSRFMSSAAALNPIDEGRVAQTGPRTAHFERDSAMFFYQHYKGLPTDRVMWRSFNSPPAEGHSLVLDPLHDLAVGKRPAKIRVFLWGSSYLHTEPDHDWSLFLNDGLLGQARWDARNYLVFESDKIGEFFHPGKPNVLMLRNNQQGRQIDAILLDWIEIDYEATLASSADFISFELEKGSGTQVTRLANSFSSSAIRVFDVDAGIELSVALRRDPSSNSYGADFRYEAGTEKSRIAAVGPEGYSKPTRLELGYPSDLRGLKVAPEYLLVTHRDFLDGARELLERRRSQGLSALLVDIDDIYDEYSSGRFSPQALKLFIDDLLTKPAADGKGLRYVFVIGDATYDYKGVYANSKSFVPTHHSTDEHLPDYAPMYACDDYFVYGNGKDEIPRAAIGRLPCRKPEDLRNFIDKIKEFEVTSAPADTTWTQRVVLIGAEGFSSFCDQNANQSPLREWKQDKIYAVPGDVEGNVKLQSRIIESISQGTGAVYFVGHGAGLRWRTGPFDPTKQTDLFTKDHMDKLTNRGRYPVAFTATCYSAMYDNPVLRGGSEAGIGVFMVQAEERVQSPVSRTLERPRRVGRTPSPQKSCSNSTVGRLPGWAMRTSSRNSHFILGSGLRSRPSRPRYTGSRSTAPSGLCAA